MRVEIVRVERVREESVREERVRVESTRKIGACRGGFFVLCHCNMKDTCIHTCVYIYIYQHSMHVQCIIHIATCT